MITINILNIFIYRLKLYSSKVPIKIFSACNSYKQVKSLSEIKPKIGEKIQRPCPLPENLQ